MKFRTGVILVHLVAAMGACQPNGDPQQTGPQNSATDGSEIALDRQDCQMESTASVRGMTGSFDSAEEAARSVNELPPEGSLVQLEIDEDRATFGWMQGSKLAYVIDTQRGDNGWTIGSYEKCTTSA